MVKMVKQDKHCNSLWDLISLKKKCENIGQSGGSLNLRIGIFYKTIIHIFAALALLKKGVLISKVENLKCFVKNAVII